MILAKYASFCVSRMIKHGSVQMRAKVINKLFGNVVKFLSLGHSSAIVDSVYVTYANNQQKAFLRQEIYGDLYKTSKDQKVKSIADTYRESEHMKAAILSSVKSNLEHFVTKKLVDNSVIHAVLLDYLNEAKEEDRNEIIAAYSPYIPSLASTKEGVRAAMICFWNSIVKERRVSWKFALI